MANTLDYNAKFWTLTEDDILRTSPVKLRSIFLIPGTKGDGINFYQRNLRFPILDQSLVFFFFKDLRKPFIIRPTSDVFSNNFSACTFSR